MCKLKQSAMVTTMIFMLLSVDTAMVLVEVHEQLIVTLFRDARLISRVRAQNGNLFNVAWNLVSDLFPSLRRISLVSLDL